jgi:hypothetical protein
MRFSQRFFRRVLISVTWLHIHVEFQEIQRIERLFCHVTTVHPLFTRKALPSSLAEITTSGKIYPVEVGDKHHA